MTFWFRIDNRLVHGQVIEAWLPFIDARALIVVNDALAGDALRQQIMQLAIPAHVDVHFIPVKQVRLVYNHMRQTARSSLFLLADCGDALRVIEEGVPVPVLNVGNMHYAEGKRRICVHVAVSETELSCLDGLRKRGVSLDFRCVPGDIPAVEDW